MPVKLSELIKTIEVALPVSGAKVTVMTAVPAYMAETVKGAETDEERVYMLLEKIVKSWDIVDEQENTVPISVEVIKQLSGNDIKFLMESALGTETPAD